MESLTPNEYTSERVAHLYGELEKAVPIRTIRSARDYNEAVDALNKLLDEGGANESHPLANLVDTLGTLIEFY